MDLGVGVEHCCIEDVVYSTLLFTSRTGASRIGYKLGLVWALERFIIRARALLSVGSLRRHSTYLSSLNGRVILKVVAPRVRTLVTSVTNVVVTLEYHRNFDAGNERLKITVRVTPVHPARLLKWYFPLAGDGNRTA